MIQLTALYDYPQDQAAFDRYYKEKHGPLASTLPGLKGYTAHKTTALSPQEKSPYYLIADLYFDSMEAVQQALQSPEGQAVVKDVENFARGSVTLVIGEVQVFEPISIG